MFASRNRHCLRGKFFMHNFVSLKVIVCPVHMHHKLGSGQGTRNNQENGQKTQPRTLFRKSLAVTCRKIRTQCLFQGQIQKMFISSRNSSTSCYHPYHLRLLFLFFGLHTGFLYFASKRSASSLSNRICLEM